MSKETLEKAVEKSIEKLENETAKETVVELTQEQALTILVQGIKLATKRGAYEIEETEILLKAIKVFTPKQ